MTHVIFLKMLLYFYLGVIAPYRKQVQQIRISLRNNSLSSIRVGTIEDYQGQEEKIIIISTVRNSWKGKDKDFDSKNDLGILFNRKRFNVAISRAKALLIVVGNPNALSLDPYWKYFIEYCIRNNAYSGCLITNQELAQVVKQKEDGNGAELNEIDWKFKSDEGSGKYFGEAHSDFEGVFQSTSDKRWREL